MHTDHYVVKSLELHLFFGRIMKEHAFFLRAGFTPANPSFSNRAEFFKREFEKLLYRTVVLANGTVGCNVLCSGEVVTEFTAVAERQTEHFTGIAINKEITAKELCLNGRKCGYSTGERVYRQVQQLNRTALHLLDGLISFKETVLHKVLCCEMFTMNYPLLIEHILREAEQYRECLEILQQEGCLENASMKETECFWNQIMMEHALFIRGLLDPSETELFHSADGFAKDYSALLENCCLAQKQSMREESLEQTLKFREFKMAGTQGIEECRIRSLILPLLADHVLREANHYIRLLQCQAES